MCFGPSKAEKKAAAEARIAADEKKQEEINEKAKKKKEDIVVAIKESNTGCKGTGRGGSSSTSTKSSYGRESLMMAAGQGSQGFLGRYG